MTELRQTADGLCHVVSPIGGGEHTLCGIAFDAHETENEPDWAEVALTGRIVTCGQCAAVVVACRGIRLAKPCSAA